MLTHARRAGFVVALAFLAAACAKEPSTPQVASDVSFVARPAIRIDVATISLDEQYGSPGRAPNVEHLHRVSPASIASAWSRARLMAVGNQGSAKLSVLDGSVISEGLAKKGGLTGIFGDQQDTKLTARLKARLTIDRPEAGGGRGEWTAEVEANAQRTILESANLNERDATYAALMQDLARKFDEALTAEVERSMRSLIR